jgi:hypothetical protein
MAPRREGKRVERALRSVPLDAIAPEIAARESAGDGLWCLVGGEVAFVAAHGERTVTDWSDPLAHAQYTRWLAAHPERAHDTHEAALAFVRSRLGAGGPAEPGAAAGPDGVRAVRRRQSHKRGQLRTWARRQRRLRVLVIVATITACAVAGATAGPVAYATELDLPLAEVNLPDSAGLGLCWGVFGALLTAAALSRVRYKYLWLTVGIAVAATWLVTFVSVCLWVLNSQ